MLSILIVDDHAIVRRGIREITEEIPGETVVDEAENGRQALKNMDLKNYGLILMDIAMPGENGLEILRQIKKMNRRQKVIILSMYSDESYVYRAMKAGADGYVTKDNTPDELVEAILTVMDGKSYISSSLKDEMDGALEDRSEEKVHARLTNREFQVMLLIASGSSVSEIADKLCISVKTVSTHRAAILDKMKMRNNSELTHYVIKEELIR